MLDTERGIIMAGTKKELVLKAMDQKEVKRVPSGFWFHFLENEIHADAFTYPELEKQLLEGEIRYIDTVQPDFVKIMTDGFFAYRNPVIQTASTAAELANLQMMTRTLRVRLPMRKNLRGATATRLPCFTICSARGRF